MRPHVLILALAIGLTSPAIDAKPAPKESVIKTCQKTRPSVALPHQLHVKAKLACKVCHHTGNNEQSCAAAAECHAGKATQKRTGCAEASLTRNAFHALCVNCHKKMSKGPKGCVQCHKK